MQYKVRTLRVQKLRNVIDVSFDFDEHLVKISWENWAGKSTIVDAIFLAIKGKTYLGRGREASNLITKWQDESKIEVTLESNEKKLTITRKIDEKGKVTLDIVSSDWGKLYQADLDVLLSEFTIDPLEFTRKSSKEQYEIVKELSWVDTTEVDAQIQEQEKKTQEVRAIHRAKQWAVKDFWPRENVETMSASEILDESTKYHNHLTHINGLENKVESCEKRLESIDDDIAEYEEKIRQLKEEKKQTNQEYMDAQGKLAEVDMSKEETQAQISELKERQANIEENNKKAEEYKMYVRLLDERKQSEDTLKENEKALDDLRDTRKQLIEWANMPIEWLAFDEKEGVLIDWLPLDQLSSAQQLVLACRIATTQNPNMKVIYIKDGSLLDSNSMELITKLANDEDYQIFVERVGEEADSIIMRDWDALSGNQ